VALTVTSADSMTLRVIVLTGAVAAGGASLGSNGTSAPSLTPTFSASLPVFGMLNMSGRQDSYTPASNNTLIDNASLSAGTQLGSGYYSGTVTATDAITVGATAGGGSDVLAYIAYEIPPLVPGTTPSISGTGPALVDTGSAPITTASFTPPAGAVLVALTAYYSANSSNLITDSSGLTWTQRKTYNYFGNSTQSIWTATVASPSVVGALLAGIP
jgi:hypothetical protein